MLIMGHPQFETQDDFGIGDGIPPIPEWQLESTAMCADTFDLSSIEIDFAVLNVFIRLRNVFQRAQQIPFSTTQIHDLTCFVVHRLLLSASDTTSSQIAPMTECIRCAIILYMFIVQGPTYYSHAVILNTIVIRLVEHLKYLALATRVLDSLDIWLVTIGMVASTGTAHHKIFIERARVIAASLHLENFRDTLVHIKNVLWLETTQSEDVFRPHWDAVFSVADQTESSYLTFCPSPYMMGTTFI
jgi:multisubunit Na+/H+ antiporter MnhF subunit